MSISETGQVPSWKGPIQVCLYGVAANTPTSRRLRDVLDFYRVGLGIPLALKRSASALSCPPGTDVFVHLHEGVVYRQDVEENYRQIEKLTGINSLPSGNIDGESAFGQVAFLSNQERAVAAVLLNQVSAAPTDIETAFVNSITLEELHQAIVIGADLPVDGVPRSMLEEQSVVTPSLWQGEFSEQEAIAYLETRPTGLCTWDVMLSRLLYDERIATSDAAAYEEVIKHDYERLRRDAASLMDDPRWTDVLDQDCNA